MTVLLKQLRHFTWEVCRLQLTSTSSRLTFHVHFPAGFPVAPLSLVFDDSFRKMLSASLQSVLNSAG